MTQFFRPNPSLPQVFFKKVKFDSQQVESLVNVLRNRTLPLVKGYIGVINHTPEQVTRIFLGMKKGAGVGGGVAAPTLKNWHTYVRPLVF